MTKPAAKSFTQLDFDATQRIFDNRYFFEQALDGRGDFTPEEAVRLSESIQTLAPDMPNVLLDRQIGFTRMSWFGQLAASETGLQILGYEFDFVYKAQAPQEKWTDNSVSPDKNRNEFWYQSARLYVQPKNSEVCEVTLYSLGFLLGESDTTPDGTQSQAYTSKGASTSCPEEINVLQELQDFQWSFGDADTSRAVAFDTE